MHHSSRPVLAALALALLLGGCDRDAAEAREGPTRAPLDEPVDASPSDAVARAEALLATDRPWRAARVMRRHLAEVETASDADRLVGARAEAGAGDWGRVHELLWGLEGLDAHRDGLGLYLLARARDELGDAAGAAETYRAFLALSPPAGALEEERAASRLRLALALLRSGDREAAGAELEAASRRAGEAAPWIELLEADALAGAGDTAAVRRTVADVEGRLLELRAWRARIEAARQAGDVAAVRALANQAREWARTDGTRAEFLVAAGRAALAMGDTARARGAFRAAVDQQAASAYARQAADLLRAGPMSPADHLAVARVHSAQGLHEESLEGYRAWLDGGGGTARERTDVRVEYANAVFYAGHHDQVAAALGPAAGETAAQLLLASAYGLQGKHDEAVQIYLRLADRFEGTGNGAYTLFLAADARHDEGDLAAARALYTRLVERYPGTDRMGLAVMRLAGIAFLEGDHAGAARYWDRYRSRYPRGERALQATYWAGRARAALGDSAAAAGLFRAARQAERESYYAVLASERLGEPFWPVPMEASPPADPTAARRVGEWLQGVDLLRSAGFPEEAADEVGRVVDRAGRDRATLYALAEALAERGYGRNAIRLAIRLQGSGPPNRRLLRILYPFPYRSLITEEAHERGIDPFTVAALIRQESLFYPRNTSHVGARGLMQMMPATGRQVAADAALEDFDPERLYHPEVNVHLGTHLLADHLEEYDGSLPAVFSAYNAGPHRVERWSRYPEFEEDEELFVERIPFSETRDYVKILIRNRALYQGLYGETP